MSRSQSPSSSNAGQTGASFGFNIQPPPALDPHADAAAWKRWKTLFEAYATISKLSERSEEERAATIVAIMGMEAIDLYHSLPFANVGEKANVSKVVEYLEEYFVGKRNEIFERYVFNSRQQQDGESVQQYIAALRKQAAFCRFESITPDKILRDRIVSGVQDEKLRRSLLSRSKLDLKECITECRMRQQAEKQAATMASGNSQERLAANQDINQACTHAARKRFKPLEGMQSQRRQWTQETREATWREQKRCQACGRQHDRGRCPAFGRFCNRCGKPNHFSNMCWAQQTNKRFAGVNRVHMSELRETDMMDKTMETSNWLGMVQCIDTEDTEWVHGTTEEETQILRKIFVNLKMEGQIVKFQVDTGATCNVIGSQDIPQGVRLSPTTKVLRLYDATPIKILGAFQTRLVDPATGKYCNAEIIVVQSPSVVPLLGAPSSLELQVIEFNKNRVAKVSLTTGTAPASKEAFIDEFADVFDGELGLLEGKVNFVVDQSVKPVKMPLRRIPLAVKEDVEEELLRLEKLGVITRETRPTDWVSGMVVAKKPSGKLRICLDPKPLNKALKRSHFPSTVLEDIIPELGKAKCFSICDITSGYWHIQLDEESSLLTTFATHMGRFRWQRLPFGVSVAPELFQERLEGAIAGLKGVCTIVDDMIV